MRYSLVDAMRALESSLLSAMLCLVSATGCSRCDHVAPMDTPVLQPIVRTRVIEIALRSAESGRLAPGVREVLNEDVRADGFPKSVTPANCGATISWWAPSPCGVTLEGEASLTAKRVIPHVRRSGTATGSCHHVTRFETAVSPLPAGEYRFRRREPIPGFRGHVRCGRKKMNGSSSGSASVPR